MAWKGNTIRRDMMGVVFRIAQFLHPLDKTHFWKAQSHTLFEHVLNAANLFDRPFPQIHGTPPEAQRKMFYKSMEILHQPVWDAQESLRDKKEFEKHEEWFAQHPEAVPYLFPRAHIRDIDATTVSHPSLRTALDSLRKETESVIRPKTTELVAYALFQQNCLPISESPDRDHGKRYTALTSIQKNGYIKGGKPVPLSQLPATQLLQMFKKEKARTRERLNEFYARLLQDPQYFADHQSFLENCSDDKIRFLLPSPLHVAAALRSSNPNPEYAVAFRKRWEQCKPDTRSATSGYTLCEIL